MQLQEGASVAEGLDNWFDFLPHSWVLLSVDHLSVNETCILIYFAFRARQARQSGT